MSTHTQRTLNFIRNQGYVAEVVERWIPGANKRRDFLGIIDIIAFNEDQTVGVQSCGEAFAAHRDKILKSATAAQWLSSPHRLLALIGWRPVAQYRKDGTRAALDRMAPRVQLFGLDGERVVAIEKSA